MSFSVNDPDLEDAVPTAGEEIVRYEVLHFIRLKGVEVKNPVYRLFNWIDNHYVPMIARP